VLAGHVGHALRPGHRARERLLDQNRLAGRQRGPGDRGVLPVRRRDVDDVHLGVRDELLVAAVRPDAARRAGRRVLGRERLGARERARPDGDELAALDHRQVPGDAVGDPPRAGDSPAQRHAPDPSA
jgi:hypothetical protein